MADYSQTSWTNGVTALSAANMNHLETQYATAKTEYQAGNWGAPPSVPVANLTGRIALSTMADGTTGQFLKAQGIGSSPIYAALVASDIPVHDSSKITTGYFTVAFGGIGLTAIAQGGILYASGADTLTRIAPTGANQVLRSTGSNALQIAALVAADIPVLDASIITSGTFDGNLLPAMSTSKKGGVPATGSPAGKFLRDDASWQAITGGGNVTGPGSSTARAIALYADTSGQVLLNSLSTIDVNGSHNIPAGQQYLVNSAQHQHATADVASGRLTAARMLDGAVGLYLRAAGAGSDPVYTSIPFTDLASGQHTLAQEPRGTNGYFLKAQGASDPIYAALVAADWTGRITAPQMLTGTGYLKAAGGDPAYQSIAIADLPTITPAYGGTGQITVPTKGDIPIGGSSILNLLSIGATPNGYVLTANSGATYGVDWETPSAASTTNLINADYIIYNVSGTYYARNTGTGAITSNAYLHTLVNNCMTALSSGGKIAFRSGAYTITSPILLLSNIQLEAQKGAYFTLASGANCAMLSSNGTWNPSTDAVTPGFDNVSIQGGDWNGNAAGQTLHGSDQRAFYFIDCTNFTVRDVVLHDTTAEAIGGIHVSGGHFYNDLIYNVYSHGAMMFACSDCWWDDNWLHDCGTGAAGGGGVYHFCDNDAFVDYVCKNIMVNNRVERVTHSGLSVSLRGPVGTPDIGNNNVIANNVIIDCGTDGAHPGINLGWGDGSYVRTALYCVVSNNTCYETGAGGVCNQGILVQCAYSNIQGNVVYNYKGPGMELRGDHNLMSNNLIYNIPNGSEGGIWLVDGNYNTISYNHIYNIAGARGIYLTELIGSGDCYNQITGNMIGNTSNYGIDVDAAGCIGNVLRDNYFFGSLPAGAIHDLGTATIIENNVGYVTDRQKLLRTGSTRPRWYTSPIACTALTTSGAVTNGRMYAMPFMTDKACTLDYFAINVTTLYAGGHMRVGIYLNANGEPGALLTEAATPFDTSGTGVKTTATTQTLLPNTLYWLALLPDNSTNVIQAAALAGIVSILGNDATLPTSPITYFYAAPGYAAMPGTFPTVSQGTGVLPLVYVRLSA